MFDYTPQTHTLKSNPQGDDARRGDLLEVIKTRRWRPFQWDWSPYIRDPRELPVLSVPWGHSEETAVSAPGSRPPRQNQAGTVCLDFQAPWRWKTNFCCLWATGSLVFCYSSPDRLRQTYCLFRKQYQRAIKRRGFHASPRWGHSTVAPAVWPRVSCSDSLRLPFWAPTLDPNLPTSQDSCDANTERSRVLSPQEAPKRHTEDESCSSAPFKSHLLIWHVHFSASEIRLIVSLFAEVIYVHYRTVRIQR